MKNLIMKLTALLSVVLINATTILGWLPQVFFDIPGFPSASVCIDTPIPVDEYAEIDD